MKKTFDAVEFQCKARQKSSLDFTKDRKGFLQKLREKYSFALLSKT